MAYAVAILLISALTTVGLLALWAATSTAHWFWRTMGFLAMISPVLLIPAYEPFVAFVIQGAVVAGGVQLAKWRTARKQGEPFFKSQFSLRTVLLAMAPVAVIVAVGVRTPELNLPAWQSIVLIGLGGGAATLAAWWIVYGRYDNWKVRALLALLMISAFSLALACGDYFVYAVDGIAGWPPDPATMGMINLFGTYADGAAVLIWTPILLLIVVLVVILSVFLTDRGSTQRFKKSKVAIAGVLLLITVAPAAFLYVRLMNPLPIPFAQIPNPNGYDEFEAATNLLPANLKVNSGTFDSETATVQELQQATDEVVAALDRVRQGLALPVMIDLDYTEDDLAINTIQSLRTIARGFDAQGRLLLKQNQPGEAAEVFIDGARFGALISRGGLMVDDLVGIACTGVACRGLHGSIQHVPIEQIPQLIAALERLETERDPWNDVVYRDRVWSQRAYGWYGQLMDIVSEYYDNGWNVSEGYEGARQQELAVLRLLQLELAMRLWRAENDGWPESIDELVPEYVSEIPVDPFSLEKERIKAVREGERLLIYSVGRNQTDDGGAEAEDEGGYRDPFTGDLRLDILYEPEPSTPVTQPSTTDEVEEAETELP
jgi:hypothetical protein